MSEELDKELHAINQIIKALESLEIDEKKRVIEYTLTRIGLKQNQSESFVFKRKEAPVPLDVPDVPEVTHMPEKASMVDIRTLTQEKEPKSAIEMATVVAFYLSELAPSEERKQVVEADDITKYFKQASFKLPGGASGGAATLRNAKNAGYLDSAGEQGAYKLNPVGYNLVAYNMPRTKRTIAKKRTPRKQTKTSAVEKKTSTKSKKQKA